MSNLEYERSFKVASVNPYIDYCKNNNFEEEAIITQNRIVYENKFSNNIIARLTTETQNGTTATFLDFKNVGEKGGDLQISTESIPLLVTDDNREEILSILETLSFYEAANNLRKRYIYSKENVKFEIDEYIRPKANVCAIEGEEIAVENIYADLEDLIKTESQL